MSWKVNDHPLLSPPSQQQQHLLQPHPFQQCPPLPLPGVCPYIPTSYDLSASFPPTNPPQFNNPFHAPPQPATSKTGQPIIMPGGVPAEFYLPKPPHVSRPFMGAPPPPPGVRMAQPSLLPAPTHGDQEIIIVAGKGRIVINGIKAVLDKTLVPIPENRLTGEIVKLCLMASVMVSQYNVTMYIKDQQFL